jgi:hypothetical protein
MSILDILSIILKMEITASCILLKTEQPNSTPKPQQTPTDILVKAKKTCIFQEMGVTMRRSHKYVSKASKQDLAGMAAKKEKREDPSSLVKGNK